MNSTFNIDLAGSFGVESHPFMTDKELREWIAKKTEELWPEAEENRKRRLASEHGDGRILN